MPAGEVAKVGGARHAVAFTICLIALAFLGVPILVGLLFGGWPLAAGSGAGFVAVATVAGVLARALPDAWTRRCVVGWAFHLALVPPTLGLLWAEGLPGSSTLGFMSEVVLLGAALGWVARMVIAVVASLQWSRTYAAAPAAAGVVAALLVLDIPLQTRWELSEGAFESAVEQMDTYPLGEHVGSVRMGTYEVWSTLRLDDGSMLFYEKHGVFMGEAGILYAPHGLQSDAASIYGRDKHLGGPWYTFAG